MRKINLIKDFLAREYQQNIFSNSINKNSFVILPTGLGKTIIALMLFVYYFNKTNKKVLFLAPTKPLVVQQKKSFEKFISNKNDFNFCEILGTTISKKREKLYIENDFFFGTPQVIENDIINKIINLDDFCFVVFDEAHRATKNYSYCFLANEFNKFNIKNLCLSASPADTYDGIKMVMENLKIEHLEIRKIDDSDVLEYVQSVKIDRVYVELKDNILEVFDLLRECYKNFLTKLKNTEIILTNNFNNYETITKTNLLNLQNMLRVFVSKNPSNKNNWEAISITSAIMKLDYGIELLSSQEIISAYNYFKNFFNVDKSKAAEQLKININFREAFRKIEELKNQNITHPKIDKLKEIIEGEIKKNKNQKIIIFNSYRDSVIKINEEINKIENIKSSIFVGQAKKNQINFSQKTQKEVLQNFREGVINVIVSTSVGEEGLDIPQANLVIFYEPIPSALRTIQRVGRVGRFESGRAIILMCEGTKEVNMNYVSSAKEKRMYKALEKVRKEINENKFFEKKKEKKLEDFNEEKIIELDDFEFNKIKKEIS